MPGISGLNGSTTLQPTTNVDELQNSQKTDDTKKTETPSDVGKTDKTGAKTELEEVVHDDTALNGQTAENFVKANTVETGKDKAVTEDKKAEGTDKKDGAEKTDKAEKKDGAEKTEGADKKEGAEKTEGTAKKDGADKSEKTEKGDIAKWFENHPKMKLAMVILEQILDTLIGVMSGIASKLPDGVGGCVTGGLSVLKGLAGFHKLDSLEKDLGTVINDVKEGGTQIAEGIAAMTSDPTSTDPTTPNADPNGTSNGTAKTCAAAKIINCVGTMCGSLSEAKGWEDAVGAVGTAAVGIAGSLSTGSGGKVDENKKAIGEAIKGNVDNFKKAFKRGYEEIKDAIKKSNLEKDEQMTTSLKLMQEKIAANPDVSDEQKKLFKTLSDAAIGMTQQKGGKYALNIFEETIGKAAADVLDEKNREIAEKTVKLMKELRSEKDPIKATMHALTAAQELTGGKVNALESLAQAVEKVGQKVDALAKGTESDKKVEADAKAILAEAGEKAKKSAEG